MRLVTLLILMAIVGGIAYVVLFQWDTVKTWFNKGTLAVQGYTPAKTPSEAMEQFIKAVNDRNYEAASIYCAGDYGEYLKKAHTGAAAVGDKADRIRSLMAEKGLHTNKSEALLLLVDPFPPKFRVSDVKKQDDKKALGKFHAELGTAPSQVNLTSELNGMDRKIMQSVLLPPGMYQGQAVQIVAEGSGDDARWKLNIPLSETQRDAINHFINNYRSYVTALTTVVDDLRQGRHAGRAEFERDLVSRLRGAKAE
jgi:hypothetical protein